VLTEKPVKRQPAHSIQRGCLRWMVKGKVIAITGERGNEIVKSM